MPLKLPVEVAQYSLFIANGGLEHNTVVSELLKNYVGPATGFRDTLDPEPFASRCPNLVSLAESVFTRSQVSLSLFNGPQGVDTGSKFLNPAEYARSTNLGVGGVKYFLGRREGANVEGGVNYHLLRNEMEELVAAFAECLDSDAPLFIPFPEQNSMYQAFTCLMFASRDEMTILPQLSHHMLQTVGLRKQLTPEEVLALEQMTNAEIKSYLRGVGFNVQAESVFFSTVNCDAENENGRRFCVESCFNAKGCTAANVLADVQKTARHGSVCHGVLEHCRALLEKHKEECPMMEDILHGRQPPELSPLTISELLQRLTDVHQWSDPARGYLLDCITEDDVLDCSASSDHRSHQKAILRELKDAVVSAAASAEGERKQGYDRLETKLKRKSTCHRFLEMWMSIEKCSLQREHDVGVLDLYLSSLTSMEREFYDLRQLAFDRGCGHGPRWTRRCAFCRRKNLDCISCHPIVVSTDCCGSNLAALQKMTATQGSGRRSGTETDRTEPQLVKFYCRHPPEDMDTDTELKMPNMIECYGSSGSIGTDLDSNIEQLGGADMGHCGVKLISAAMNYWLTLPQCNGSARGVWLCNISRVLLAIWEDPVFGPALQVSKLTLADLRHRDRQAWSVFLHLLAECCIQALVALREKRVVVKLVPETIMVSSSAGPGCLVRPNGVHVPDHLVAYVCNKGARTVDAIMLSSPVYRATVGDPTVFKFTSPVAVTSIGNILFVADATEKCIYFSNVSALAEPNSRVEKAVDAAEEEQHIDQNFGWRDKPRVATKRAAAARWHKLTDDDSRVLYLNSGSGRLVPQFLSAVATRTSPFAEGSTVTPRLYVLTTGGKLWRVNVQNEDDVSHSDSGGTGEGAIYGSDVTEVDISGCVVRGSKVAGLATLAAFKDPLYPDRVLAGSVARVDTICLIIDGDIVLLMVNSLGGVLASQIIVPGANAGAVAIDAENRRLAFTRPDQLSVYECDMVVWECTKPRCIAGPGTPGMRGDMSGVGSSARWKSVTDIAFFGRSVFVVDEEAATLKVITSAEPIVSYLRMVDSFMRPHSLCPNTAAQASNVLALGWSGQDRGLPPTAVGLMDSDGSDEDGSDEDGSADGFDTHDEEREYMPRALCGRFVNHRGEACFRVMWKGFDSKEAPNFQPVEDVESGEGWTEVLAEYNEIRAQNEGSVARPLHSTVEDFSGAQTDMPLAIELFGYGMTYLNRLEELGHLRFGTRHGAGREGLMSSQLRKSMRLQNGMLIKLHRLLQEYAPVLLDHISLGTLGSECNEHNNNFMREKRELMTQLEYALHQASIDVEMAKAAAGDLGFRYFTRAHSAQAKRSQYRHVKRKADRTLRRQRMEAGLSSAFPIVFPLPFKKNIVRRPRQTEVDAVHRRRHDLRLTTLNLTIGKAKKLVQRFCTRCGAGAKQGTIRATTTRENIGCLPHFISHGQDTRTDDA